MHFISFLEATTFLFSNIEIFEVDEVSLDIYTRKPVNMTCHGQNTALQEPKPPHTLNCVCGSPAPRELGNAVTLDRPLKPRMFHLAIN